MQTLLLTVKDLLKFLKACKIYYVASNVRAIAHIINFCFLKLWNDQHYVGLPKKLGHLNEICGSNVQRINTAIYC